MSDGDLVAVHPGTGEVLERLDQQPPEVLADAIDTVRAQIAERKQWEAALEGELRRRLRILGDRTFAQFGDWEVRAGTERSRAWDPDELEGVLAHLCDQGVIQAAETADVIERNPTVAGKAALELRGRLGPEAQAAIDTAWKWKERRKPLTVTRSVDLLQAADPAPGAPARELEPPLEPAPAAPGNGPHEPAPGPVPAPAPIPPLTPEELFA